MKKLWMLTEVMETAELQREEEEEQQQQQKEKDRERKGRRRKNKEEELQLLASCPPSKRAPGLQC